MQKVNCDREWNYGWKRSGHGRILTSSKWIKRMTSVYLLPLEPTWECPSMIKTRNMDRWLGKNRGNDLGP